MLAYVVLLIGAPLISVVQHALSLGFASFGASITAPVALQALLLTVRCAIEISLINALMGTAVAWVLARYRIPGKGFFSAVVELPFALPTLVAGVMLSTLFGPHSFLGKAAAASGVPVIFAKPGIILALLFVTLPLVVRSVEPVILGLDRAEEEAAFTLGASRILIFFWVTLRSLAPAITYGSIQCFARAIAEFGAVVVISGNIPYRTLTAPVFILGEVESGKTESAAAVSLMLLILAVLLSYLTRAVQRRLSTATG